MNNQECEKCKWQFSEGIKACRDEINKLGHKYFLSRKSPVDALAELDQILQELLNV